VPTKRAPDVWESAAFSSIFLASSFPCSQALSTPAHTQVTQTVGRSHLNSRFLVGFMEKIELNITYQVSDLVSASLAYRKYVQDKTLIFIAWLFTVYVLGTYLLPTLFFTLFCIPFHSCSSVDLWNIVKIFSLSIFSCSFMFFSCLQQFLASYQSRICFAFTA